MRLALIRLRPQFPSMMRGRTARFPLPPARTKRRPTTVRDEKRAPQPWGPFLLRFGRVALRRGPPGGCGSGTILIGRALRNKPSTISGLVHPIGPHRVNRCSHNESSLVNRSTSLGAGPSIDGVTVSSRATSSATQRRPLGSVYLAANARRLVISMACGRGCPIEEQGLVRNHE